MTRSCILWALALLCLAEGQNDIRISHTNTQPLKGKRIVDKLTDPYGLLNKTTPELKKIRKTQYWNSYNGDSNTVRTPPSQDFLLDVLSEFVSGSVQESKKDKMASVGQSRMSSGAMANVLKTFLKFVGIDATQLGILLINILIFIAEMVTSTLIGNSNSSGRSVNGADLVSSLLSPFSRERGTKLSEMSERALNPNLPRLILDNLEQKTGNSTACLQLLVCKSSPVVWGLQKSIKDSKADLQPPLGHRKQSFQEPFSNTINNIYKSLPSLDEFLKFSDSCEQQFSTCKLIDFN